MFPKPEKRKKKARKRLGERASRRTLRRLYSRLVRPAYLAGLAAGQGRRDGLAVCERCGDKIVGEVHHLAGKEGENLIDARNLAGLCSACHDKVHDRPAQAKEEGWLRTRHQPVVPSEPSAAQGSDPDAERD